MAVVVGADLLGCLALCLLTVAAFGRFADTRSVWVSAVVVALLAGGHWRVILWASIGTVTLLVASLVWPGLDYWPTHD